MHKLLQNTIGRMLLPWNRHAQRDRRFVMHLENVLGTSLELQLTAGTDRAAKHAESVVLAAIDELEPILSGWSETSELSRWMATRNVDVRVSTALIDVLDASNVWRERTAGAFDPAAYAVTTALRACHGVPTIVAEDPLWTVNHANRTARRLTPHAISLDAIAKGYIVSRAATRAFEVDGVTGVLLNIGGDIQHFGARVSSVGIADPTAPAENAPSISVVRIQNAALATSGGYRRRFIANGQRVSHIVDARTGRPADAIISASVFAPDCTAADALSTAFSVMHPQESVALADSLPGVGCLIVERSGAITTSTTWTTHSRP